MENSRICDICNIDVHRAFYAQHLSCKKHLEKEEQDDMIILECLIKNLLKIKVKEYIILNP